MSPERHAPTGEYGLSGFKNRADRFTVPGAAADGAEALSNVTQITPWVCSMEPGDQWDLEPGDQWDYC
jgi:hypothetical protein